MLLEIDDDQRDVLAAVIRRELDELGPEIHHTSSSSYRADLKTRRETLNRLLGRLVPATPVEK